MLNKHLFIGKEKGNVRAGREREIEGEEQGERREKERG